MMGIVKKLKNEKQLSQHVKMQKAEPVVYLGK
jgi:hypothetical protein